jgi:hypothetical protein
MEIHGSCLCKKITFSIVVPETTVPAKYPLHFTSSGKLRATNCHCTTCRRSVGALVGTWAHVPANFFTVSDLAMCTGTYRTSEQVTRKFCRVCGTSLFSPEDGWNIIPENTEVSNLLYNREIHGKVGKTVDVSVAAMDIIAAKRFVEVVEHIFLEDTIDGGQWASEKSLPRYIIAV